MNFSVTAPTQGLWGRKRVVMMNTEIYLCFSYVQKGVDRYVPKRYAQAG